MLRGQQQEQQEDEELTEAALGSVRVSAVTTKHHLIGLSSNTRRTKVIGLASVCRSSSMADKLAAQRGSASSRAGRSSEPISKPTGLSLKVSLFVLVLVLVLAASRSRALNCYHCSSVDNPECDEPFTGRANFTETNCERSIGRPAKVCRKIVQYIEHKKVVIRSCGFIDEHEEKDRKDMCYKRSGTFAIMMESCNCYTDNCNHSASLVPTQSVLSILTLLASLSFILFKKVGRSAI